MPIILDAKYEKSDLNMVMTKKCKHLSTKEQERLLKLLQQFECLFDGTLGTRKTDLVYLELQYNVKPIFSQPYTVPRIHEDMFKK